MIKKRKLILIILTFCVLIFCVSCKKSNTANKTATSNDTKNEKFVSDKSYVSYDETKQFDYFKYSSCKILDNKKEISYIGHFNSIPKSDDNFLYLFNFNAYENPMDFSKKPLAKIEKDIDICITFDYKNNLLFNEYVPCIKYKKDFIPLATGRYIENPQIRAKNQSPALTAASKKGLLIDTKTLDTPLLDDLKIKHAVYNMPLSFFLGQEQTQGHTMVEYQYAGETYYFKESSLMAYDTLYKKLSDKGIVITAIILNDWNGSDETSLLVDSNSKQKSKNICYYQFNTTDEKAVKTLEATALFLSKRYSTGEHGLVSNWIIGNEINQHSFWNYMNTTDITEYVTSLEKSFRIFYNAIKSNYANANVFFSIDHDWNSNNGNNAEYFNGKEIIDTFNQIASKKNNYDWCIAIHPYPVPLTRVNYWSQEYDMTENASILTIMNLNTITSFLEDEQYLNSLGEMRNIAITELGYTSRTGENLQAAAFAYGYKIVEDNPHISMFLLNRQVDALAEMKDGLFLGLYNIDYSPKYITEVFSNIDTEKASEYDELILNIIDANSMDEALSWAKPIDTNK